MFLTPRSVLVALLTLIASGAPAACVSEDQPGEATVRVVFETALGEGEVALNPERAPLSVAQFLRHVEGGHYEGAAFYRPTHTAAGDAHDVVQGGLRSLPMLVDSGGEAPEEPPFPPIAGRRP